MAPEHEEGRHRAGRMPSSASAVPGQPFERGSDLSGTRWEASSASDPRPPWEPREPREELPNPYARPISATPPEVERPRSPWAPERWNEDANEPPEGETDEREDEAVAEAETDDADTDPADSNGEHPWSNLSTQDAHESGPAEVAADPLPKGVEDREGDDSDDPGEPQPNRPAAVVVGIGIGLGVLLAAAAVLGLTGREGPFQLAGLAVAAVVVAILTAVAVRRGIGGDWRISAVLGVVAGLAVAGRDFGPAWLQPLLVVYAATIGGLAAVLLTRPVRKLTGLVVEYGIAILCAAAGAGAVGGILSGAAMSRTVRAAAVTASISVALLIAVGVRTRLTERKTTTGEFVFIGLFVAAVIVAAAAIGVITGDSTPSMLSRLLDGIWGGILLIALPFALLGVGTVVRVWTPAGWWICAPAVTGTAMVAAVVGSDGAIAVGPVALGVLGGCLAGFVLTVITALLVGMRMRSPSQRGKRIWRDHDEPARLAAI
jgi:hypothetical protein